MMIDLHRKCLVGFATFPFYKFPHFLYECTVDSVTGNHSPHMRRQS